MNNRCVEHVLEDNKWTVLVLIVSDDIGILGNSHMGIRAQQHHEHRSFHTKLLRHLKVRKLRDQTSGVYIIVYHYHYHYHFHYIC